MEEKYSTFIFDMRQNLYSIGELSKPERINTERAVAEHYRDRGYNVQNISPYSELPEKYSEKNAVVEKGVPDLFVYSNNTYFFVEVKSRNGGLRMEQVTWISKHDSEPVKIFYLTQEDFDPEDMAPVDKNIQETSEEDQENIYSPGPTTVIKKIPCGKECNGCPHGPYEYEVQRDGDKLKWDYIGAVE